jgi:hypothetical protein
MADAALFSLPTKRPSSLPLALSALARSLALRIRTLENKIEKEGPQKKNFDSSKNT